MSSAGATDPRGLRAPSVPAAGGSADPVRRLETALDRIAAGLARQAERAADRRDRAGIAAVGRGRASSGEAPDVVELRERLDRLIAVLRTAIDEAEG